MIIQVETVSFSTEPSEYIDTFDLHDTEWTYETSSGCEHDESAQYVINVPLDTLIDNIDNTCIVKRPSGVRHYDEAEWAVRVYDDYNE